MTLSPIILTLSALALAAGVTAESATTSSAVSPLPANRVIPEASMDVPQLIVYNGYPLERHNVTTLDGYQLELFRINGGRHSNESESAASRIVKKVAFLQHGLLDSSEAWVVNTPEHALAFIL